MTLDKPFYGTGLWVENIDQVDAYPWITFLGSDVIDTLTGQTATFAEGTLTYGVAYAPTPQTLTSSEGTIGPEADYAATAQSSTFAEGVALPEADYFPSNQTGSFLEGTITATGGDIPPPPVVLTIPPGGTGSSKRKIKRAREVFAEEMAKLERQAVEATEQRAEIEEKLATSSPYEPLPEDLQKWLRDFENALRRAQAREKREHLPEVPVYFQIPVKSEGVKRVEAYKHLEALARVARYREERAQERLRKVRERIDFDAATSFMLMLMSED